MTCRKTRTAESKQSRTEIDKSERFVNFVMFLKLIFRQNNIVCIGISSLLLVKTNNLVMLTCFARFWEKQLLLECFIQNLSLNVHSYFNLFLHWSISSFDNHWRYQQRYRELLGRKSRSFLWCNY